MASVSALTPNLNPVSAGNTVTLQEHPGTVLLGVQSHSNLMGPAFCEESCSRDMCKLNYCQSLPNELAGMITTILTPWL